MGKITLVTGGARSGKSSYGEGIIKNYGKKILYIATSISFDEEMEKRISIHKGARPTYWDTLEEYKDLSLRIKNIEKDYEGILLDCITNLITNLLFDKDFNRGVDVENLDSNGFEALEIDIMKEIKALLENFKSRDYNVVIITNEIGSGIVPESKLSREFRDIQGRVNQYIAKNSDEVFFVVSGIPMKIK